ncbi:MAG: virulence RhuM family protein, partial [Gammaproteobacteria bacterium]|nr:virulence RhuM family protein [Gammaproteobacteria bacterium]
MENSDIKIYQLEDGKAEISVHLDKETVWLSLNQMTELFERDKSVISRHINNIFKESELSKSSVVAKNATTALDGKTYQVDYFNLDVIISVGYRIQSKRGTQFRIWSNQIIKDYLVQGYTLNRKRLEQKSRQYKELQESIK